MYSAFIKFGEGDIRNDRFSETVTTYTMAKSLVNPVTEQLDKVNAKLTNAMYNLFITQNFLDLNKPHGAQVEEVASGRSKSHGEQIYTLTRKKVLQYPKVYSI